MKAAFLHGLRCTLTGSAPWVIPVILVSWFHGAQMDAPTELGADGAATQWLHLPCAWAILVTGMVTLQIWPPFHRGPDASTPERSPLLRLPVGPADGCLAAWGATVLVATLWLGLLGAGSAAALRSGAIIPDHTWTHSTVDWSAWSQRWGPTEGRHLTADEIEPLRLPKPTQSEDAELWIRAYATDPSTLLNPENLLTISTDELVALAGIPFLEAGSGAPCTAPLPHLGMQKIVLLIKGAPNAKLHFPSPLLLREPIGPHPTINGATATLAWLPNLATALALCALLRHRLSRNTSSVVLLGVAIAFALPQQLTPTIEAMAAMGRGHWVATAPDIPGVWGAVLLPLVLMMLACFTERRQR